MAATVRASYYGGSGTEPAGSTAETGITFSRSDAKAPAAGTSPIPKPTSTGTNYSWIMQIALEVTGTASTSLSNRTIALSTTITSGTRLWVGNQATYRQPASGNKPTDSGSAGPATPTATGSGTPAAYATIGTAATTWDSTSTAGTVVRNGNFAELVFGVDNSYAGGGGQLSLPNLLLTYDEA